MNLRLSFSFLNVPLEFCREFWNTFEKPIRLKHCILSRIDKRGIFRFYKKLTYIDTVKSQISIDDSEIANNRFGEYLDHLKSRIGRVPWSSRITCFASFCDQIRIVQSSLQLAKRFSIVGCHFTQKTGPPWPFIGLNFLMKEIRQLYWLVKKEVILRYENFSCFKARNTEEELH